MHNNNNYQCKMCWNKALTFGDGSIQLSFRTIVFTQYIQICFQFKCYYISVKLCRGFALQCFSFIIFFLLLPILLLLLLLLPILLLLFLPLPPPPPHHPPPPPPSPSQRLAGASLLVLANKQDLPSAMTAEEIRDVSIWWISFLVSSFLFLSLYISSALCT